MRHVLTVGELGSLAIVPILFRLGVDYIDPRVWSTYRTVMCSHNLAADEMKPCNMAYLGRIHQSYHLCVFTKMQDPSGMKYEGEESKRSWGNPHRGTVLLQFSISHSAWPCTPTQAPRPACTSVVQLNPPLPTSLSTAPVSKE